MKAKIQQRLQELEQQAGITILYACESGSRAWGFASPDSDYDVRFIYTHPIDWYLSIENRKDAIDLPLDPNDIDLSGWELRKTLGLFRKSNGPLLEWLQSPIIYKNKNDFRERLWSLQHQYSSNKALIHHYLGIANNVYREYSDTYRIKIKRYFYILRPLLAAKWVLERESPAPTEFSKLLGLLTNRPMLLQHIEGLLAKKAEVGEGHFVDVIPELSVFIDKELKICEHATKKLHSVIHKTEALNQLFRTLIKEHDTAKSI